MEEKEKYIILRKDREDCCGGPSCMIVKFVNTLNLEEIEKAIEPINQLVYNDDAEVYEIKKVKKPLFPEG